jgi:hypothetical protein
MSSIQALSVRTPSESTRREASGGMCKNPLRRDTSVNSRLASGSPGVTKRGTELVTAGISRASLEGALGSEKSRLRSGS